jgi:hypothetical protein
MARAATQPGEDSSCKFNNLIIENFGVSGNDGRIGALERKVNYLKADIKELKQFNLKILMIAAAGAGVGGGAVAGLMKLLAFAQ